MQKIILLDSTLLCMIVPRLVITWIMSAYRQVTNDEIGVPRCNEEKLQVFFENGDPKMEFAASRVIENFFQNHLSKQNYISIRKLEKG